MLSQTNLYVVNTTTGKTTQLTSAVAGTSAITFSDGYGEIGRLYVENNDVCFEGNMDESTRLFLNHVNFDLEKMRELAHMSGELFERQRVLEIIEEWVNNPIPLITDLVKKIRHPISLNEGQGFGN